MLILNAIPFYYFLKTRLEGVSQKISWVFVYFIPSIYLYSCFQDISSIRSFLVMAIAITLVNYVYEDGYITNDVRTVKKEKDPTLRLSEDEFSLIERNFNRLIFFRIVVTVALLVCFKFLLNDNATLIKLIFVMVLTKFVFSYYNSIRNFFNLILIFPLSFLRFYGYILPFIAPNELALFLIIASFLYPLTKMIEFTRLPRYELPRIAQIVGSVDLFRVRYYFLLVLVLGVLTFYQVKDHLRFYFNVSIYYLVYRLLTYLSSKLTPQLLAKKKNGKKDHFRSS